MASAPRLAPGAISGDGLPLVVSGNTYGLAPAGKLPQATIANDGVMTKEQAAAVANGPLLTVKLMPDSPIGSPFTPPPSTKSGTLFLVGTNSGHAEYVELRGLPSGTVLYFKDESGNALFNNINFSCVGGSGGPSPNSIDGQPTALIQSNNGALGLVCTDPVENSWSIISIA